MSMRWLLFIVWLLANVGVLVFGYFAVVAGVERVSKKVPRVVFAALMATSIVLWISFVSLVLWYVPVLLFPSAATE
jgi:hypothetical protein